MKDREKIFLNEYARMIKEGVYSWSEWRKFFKLRDAIKPYLFNRNSILVGQTEYSNAWEQAI